MNKAKEELSTSFKDEIYQQFDIPIKKHTFFFKGTNPAKYKDIPFFFPPEAKEIFNKMELNKQLASSRDANNPDLPNFSTWSDKNLADFAVEAYLKLQEQQEVIEQQNLTLLAVRQLIEPRKPD